MTHELWHLMLPPGGLQVGGGINDENAISWIDAGAEKLWCHPTSIVILPSSYGTYFRS
jgi:phosphoribosylformimino-5-aminoimidazole carboxamide ribonucleotide (ProFAR) isomerase